MLMSAAPAAGATLTVTTTHDERMANGACSLREAIDAVNSPGTPNDCGTASSGANTIVRAAHTYPLTLEHLLFRGQAPPGCFSSVTLTQATDNSQGELSVAGTVHGLTIKGAGQTKTVLDACKLGPRALEVKSGATVTLQGLTITNGYARDGNVGQDGQFNG